MRKNWNKGKNNPFYGKKHTKETKKLIGLKSKLKWTPEYRENFYRKRYKGRKHKAINGYILVKDYKHPNRNSHNDVLEHIKVMSNKIKRPVRKGEIVHHINFIREDNRKENLYLYKNISEHGKCSKSLFKLVKYLLDNNIIIFKRGIYKIV